MKRILCAIIIFSAAIGAFAISYDDFKDSFSTFADDAANSLPFNALIGLNWSDAYIGQFPHLGFGLTIGMTTIPIDAVTAMMDSLGTTLPSDADIIEKIGLPIPSYTAEIRIGGFKLPFDVGFKLGWIPRDFAQNLTGDAFSVDYILVGGEVRYALVKETVPLPTVSVGLGYSYMKGQVLVNGIYSGDFFLTGIPGQPAGLYLSNPDLNFSWQTSVIDLKVQVSKRLLIITPFIGLGAAYGASSVDGGLTSQLLVGGNPITPAQIAAIIAAFKAAGMDVPDELESGTGVVVHASSPSGWAVRTFGGIGINLFILRLDVTGMYNFTSGSYGLMLNTRIQF
jgi:hypothetical protein